MCGFKGFVSDSNAFLNAKEIKTGISVNAQSIEPITAKPNVKAIGENNLPSTRVINKIGVYAKIIIVTEKKISRPTSCAAIKVILIMPSFLSSTVALRYLRIRCSAIIQAPSTIIPKSIAPSESKFAGMCANFINIKAKSKENGIVAVTTKAALILPKNKIKTINSLKKKEVAVPAEPSSTDKLLAEIRDALRK